MADQQAASNSGKALHKLDLHDGEALWALAGTYDTIPRVLTEVAQNAIDADATLVFIGIDASQRLIVIADNGTGVDEQKFQLALRSVGKTVKHDTKRQQLGRFGRGLISPLDKCELYEIFSRPIGPPVINHWTFVPKDLREQEEFEGIPFERLRTLPKMPLQFARPYAKLEQSNKRWRTIAKLTGVTTDKSVSQVELSALRRLMLSQLGQGMRRNGVVVHVVMYDEHNKRSTCEISPAAYTGEPLEERIITRNDCGEVRFRLYRAPRSQGMRRGQVVVQKTGDPCAVAWQDFVMQATGTGVFKAFPDLRESFDTIGSGYFEGTIEIESIELHPERTKFVRTDALLGAYVAINEWFQKFGRNHYEIEHEARRDERYRELGGKALDYVLERLLADDAFLSDLLQLMELLPVRLLDQSDSSSVPVQDERPPREPGQPRRKRVVVGPKHRRKRDRDHTAEDTQPAELEEMPGQFALQFAYEVLPDSDRLFEFDFNTGIITFNVGHPTWTRVDETDGKHTARNDKQIVELQQWLAFKILRLLARHPNSYDFESARGAMIDDEVAAYVAMFIVR